MSRLVSFITFVFLLLLHVSSFQPAQAQEQEQGSTKIHRAASAVDGGRSQPLSFPATRAAGANSLVQDVLAVTSMAAKGNELYALDANRQTWGRYCGMSRAFAEAGEFRDALQAAIKALYLGESTGDIVASAYAMRDIAFTYQMAKDWSKTEYWAQQAIDYGQRAKAMNRSVDFDFQILSEAHRMMGDARVAAGNAAAAIAEYEIAIKLLPWVGGAIHKERISLAIGNAHRAAGEYVEAAKLFTSLVDSRGVTGVLARRGLAEVFLAQRKPDEAIAQLKAISEASSTDTEFDRLRADALLGKALLLNDQREQAAVVAWRAANQAFVLRGKFRSEEIKTGFFSSVQEVFDDAVDVLVLAGRINDALIVSDMSRGRQLRDQVLRVRSMAAASTDLAALSVDDLKSKLSARTGLIVYHLTARQAHAWIVTAKQVTYYALPTDATRVQHAAAAYRAAIASVSSDYHEHSRSLFDQVGRPLLDTITKLGLQEVVIAPHRSLHLVPLSALEVGVAGGGTYWLENIPSVLTVMTPGTLARSPRALAADGLLAVGNPDLGEAALDLPHAESEARQIASLFSGPELLVRRDAMKSTFLTRLSGKRVLHLATHAELDPLDAMRSRIWLAGPIRKAALEAKEVLALDMSGVELVALSSCETGLGVVATGDEFYGFKRAAMGAGAKNLLVSLWPVDDAATAEFMTKFYTAARQAPLGEAFQQAVAHVRSQARFASPYFWSAFILVSG